MSKVEWTFESAVEALEMGWTPRGGAAHGPDSPLTFLLGKGHTVEVYGRKACINTVVIDGVVVRVAQ